MEWADEVRTLKIRTNADTPHDAEVARRFGAEGIGPAEPSTCFDDERILHARQMILAQNAESRAKALEKLLPFNVKTLKAFLGP